MNIGEKLKIRRKELGLTMLQVAKRTGVSEATISRWESGDIANMRRDKIVSLANALQITPAFIMEESENPANLTEDNPIEEGTVIFNRNGETIKKKFTKEQMDYLDKFMNSISEDNSDL